MCLKLLLILQSMCIYGHILTYLTHGAQKRVRCGEYKIIRKLICTLVFLTVNGFQETHSQESMCIHIHCSESVSTFLLFWLKKLQSKKLVQGPSVLPYYSPTARYETRYAPCAIGSDALSKTFDSKI